MMRWKNEGMMKTKVSETEAAMIADQEDNPKIPMTEDEEYRNAGITKEEATGLKLKPIESTKKPFGRGGFGQGKPHDPMYLKDLQRNRILKKLDLIKDRLGDMKQIIVLLEEQLTKLK